MQQFERYGVIALVFLLVTIVAVSFWGDSKSPGFWSRLTGKSDGKKEKVDTAAAIDPLAQDHVVDPSLPLDQSGGAVTIPPGPELANGNQTSVSDRPPTPMNPFLPTDVNTQPAPPSDIVITPTAPQPVYTPPAPATTQYVVQSGDSLARIARTKLGSESRWTEIQALNGGLDPKNLRVGQTIQLPAGAATKPASPTFAKASAETHAPKSTPPAKPSTSSYVVKKGDSLRAIAREQLGDESRWTEIVAANPGVKPERIHPGDRLKLPASSRASSSPRTTSGTNALAAAAPSTASGSKPQVR